MIRLVSRMPVKCLSLFFVILLGIVSSGCSSSESIENSDISFVYAVTLNDLTSFKSALITQHSDTIYMMADVLGVIAPRETRVYYWPLTNRYLADWPTLNQLIEGELEVFQDGRLVTTVPLKDYVVQYDNNNVSGSLGLFTGQDAINMYEKFQIAQQQYQQAMFDYYDAKNAWTEEMDKIYQQIADGATIDNFPKEPATPEDFTIYSSPLVKGYPIKLPEGKYSIRTKLANGTIYPGSEKNLVMFRERRKSVVYGVIPESRWTKPAQSNTTNSVIYVYPDTNIYLQPAFGSEYQDLSYTRMTDPEDKIARKDRWEWVSQLPIQEGSLRIYENGNLVSEEKLGAFYVRQSSGSSLSYSVVPFDPESMDQISFKGFAIGRIAKNSSYKIELLDDEGKLVPGSEREIRTINTKNGLWIYVMGVVSFLVGLVIVVVRKSKTGNNKKAVKMGL